jgi:hypothetical protein
MVIHVGLVLIGVRIARIRVVIHLLLAIAIIGTRIHLLVPPFIGNAPKIVLRRTP